MKKRIIRMLLLMVLFFSMKINVNAATASASIKVSTSSTVVGNSGTATLTITADEVIGQIYGTFTCGGLGSKDLTYSASDSPSKSRSYTINWKAKTAGTYTCQVNNLEIGTLETLDWPKVSVSSKTIKVVSATSNKPSGGGSGNNSSSNSGTTADKKKYSSDNYLKSLNIDGYELSPKFDKETLEYKLTVDQSVEMLKVSATANDNKASVSGTGEIKLSSGENTINVKVIAENGNEKIYKIVVVVDDLNPIKVKIGKEEFTVVKKNNSLIDLLDNYNEVVIKISDQDVVAYENTKNKVTLVLLKDSDNKVGYYIYDKEKNTYEKYRYITVNGVTLQLIDNPLNLKNYTKYTLEIQNEKIDYYKIKGSHKVGLIYGINVKTGNTGYYVYDQSEETLSKYYDKEVNIYKEEVKKNKSYLMAFIGGVALVSIVIIIVSLVKSRNKRKSKYKI